MNNKGFLLSVVGILVSFAGGFLLANALNRRELDDLRGEVGRLKAAQPPAAEKTDAAETLSDEEIGRKIAEADSHPENTEFQKGLAIALYRYASMKQEAKWLPEVARLLGRVHEKNPKDYNTLVSLGNIYFDISQAAAFAGGAGGAETNKNLEKSRGFYEKALAVRPDDGGVRTDFGLTYLAETPPQNEKAVSEFRKSLQLNPADQRALENITRGLINEGKTKEAEEFLEKLRRADPAHAALAELDSLLAAAKKNVK